MSDGDWGVGFGEARGELGWFCDAGYRHIDEGRRGVGRCGECGVLDGGFGAECFDVQRGGFDLVCCGY